MQTKQKKKIDNHTLVCTYGKKKPIRDYYLQHSLAKFCSAMHLSRNQC